MDNSIVVALITGGMSLIGVILTGRQQAREIDHKLDKQQAVTNTKLDELTREVREHNNFARRVPVIEEQNRSMENRMAKVEGVLYGGKAS